jgi:hypothetical protein
MSSTQTPGLQDALRELYRWAAALDFAGHDPHDLLTSPLLSRMQNPLARLVAVQLGRRSAVNVRALLRVPRAENPKALALFINGLLRARDVATPDWNQEAENLGKRLLGSMNKNGGWGYPFPWQSRTHYLPSGTPNIVTTSFAGNALIELHRHSASPILFDAIQKSAVYIVSLDTGNPKPAFGYAKNDPQIVFNASLLGAEFLLKAGRLLSNSAYVELACHVAEFVADHQRADGGWDYGLEKSQRWTDSFHTGFVICSMKAIADAVGDDRLQQSAFRGFEYYRQTFLEPDYAIRYFPGKRYPIDAHALGQAMVTFTTFGEQETAQRIAEWSIANLRSPKGCFYYQQHGLFTNRIPYMRWSNAWMFRGLSSLTSSE